MNPYTYEHIGRTCGQVAIGLGIVFVALNAIVFASALTDKYPIYRKDLPGYRLELKRRLGPIIYYATTPGREVSYLLRAK